MSNNNIDINIDAKVDKEALAANLASFSSGLIGNVFNNFYQAIIDYVEKDKEISSSGETIELDNGVKFRWER